MGLQMYFDSYSPVGDITVIVMCLAVFALISGSYIKKTTNSGIFVNIVIYLMFAAIADIVHHIAYNRIVDSNYLFINVVRFIYHGLLFSILLLYVVYIVSLLKLTGVKKRIIMSVSLTLYVTVLAGDIYATATGPGFRGDPAARTMHMINVFVIGFSLFLMIIIYLTIRFGRYLYKRVMMGFYATIGLAILIHLTQLKHMQNSYTVVSFLPPTIAILYFLHSNPIDARLGAADARSLEDTVNFYRRMKTAFLFTSLHLKELDQESNKMPDELRDIIRGMAERIFKSGSLYQISGGHFIFIAGKERNVSYLENSRIALRMLREKLKPYGYTYRIVIGESIDEISVKNEYVSFLRDIERRMDPGEVHIVKPDDVSRFRENDYIIRQLSDIAQKNDPDDPRVLAY